MVSTTKDAGVVFAYGTATGKADYNLSDNIANDQAKIIYYRLRSVDIDGKGQLSQPVSSEEIARRE
ncbi:MAG: hypothetical protein IPN39_16070 [Chitinophagaceae bacterium]|nr:hypothetical protein [Chitinophagaceae bacterium]